jgi:DNA-binding winged helix-turn-helix (wHTH) protein
LVREDKPVPLSPKSFELLVFVVSNHGRLLAKNQMFENVWTDDFVEESSLTVSISALRRAPGIVSWVGNGA